jgi:uncharacterized protein
MKVQLAAPPADGEANAALVELLGDRLALKKKSVTIVSGHGSRKKRVRLLGVSEERLLSLLA